MLGEMNQRNIEEVSNLRPLHRLLQHGAEIGASPSGVWTQQELWLSPAQKILHSGLKIIPSALSQAQGHGQEFCYGWRVREKRESVPTKIVLVGTLALSNSWKIVRNEM